MIRIVLALNRIPQYIHNVQASDKMMKPLNELFKSYPLCPFAIHSRLNRVA